MKQQTHQAKPYKSDSPLDTMNYLVLGASLNPNSRSQRLARELVRMVKIADPESSVELLDLRDYDLPLCDGDACYDHPQVKELRKLIEPVDGILLTGPVYNYYLNAAAKNLMELTGRTWMNKVVGFLCSAGGQSSYMSIMALAEELMLDFRCYIVPRFVYVTGAAFKGDELSDPDVRERMGELARELVRATRGLRG